MTFWSLIVRVVIAHQLPIVEQKESGASLIGCWVYLLTISAELKHFGMTAKLVLHQTVESVPDFLRNCIVSEVSVSVAERRVLPLNIALDLLLFGQCLLLLLLEPLGVHHGLEGIALSGCLGLFWLTNDIVSFTEVTHSVVGDVAYARCVAPWRHQLVRFPWILIVFRQLKDHLSSHRVCTHAHFIQSFVIQIISVILVFIELILACLPIVPEDLHWILLIILLTF